METLPSPARTTNNLDQPNAHRDTQDPRPFFRKDYATGISLLMIVVILWTSSNFLTQDLYEGGYNKPFLVTYMNTSSFSFYLIPFLVRRWWTRRHNTKPFVEDGAPGEYQPLANNDDNVEEPQTSLDNYSGTRREPLPPLTNRQTADLAFTFCLMWFIANWSVNASLGYTSVASATILSSMRFFTLAIGRLFRVEKLTILKIGAVFASFMGVILVSLSDSESTPAAVPALHLKGQQVTVDSRATMGDMLALISALFYAMYVILLKVRIKSESRIDMQLFFGFVGLFNILACWPIGLILHFTGGEVFELPPSRKALSAVAINMAITLSSDYLYVLAMLKTTPLVVTIGLSLTIPVAVGGDFLRHRPTHGEVIAGAVLILFSFVLVGFEDSKEQQDIAPPVTIENQES
ncbi:hypothetical protein BDZ97DRAFT_1912469 [Flammula alnicola]|nr:hypothetical protein BDZ97DRAFT_1912469 [Flammula alnicola]